MIEFKNGSKIISITTNDNIRGVRSNFITCNCYDTENEEWVIKTLDMREPVKRFVPECCYIDSSNI